MFELAQAAQEQAVPGWVIAVAFAVPAVIMLLVLRWALKGRARQGRQRRAARSRRGGEALDRGSAAAIPDGGEYNGDALLRALSVKPEDHGPDGDGNPHDEGSAGTMLGLRSKISSSTDLLEPHLYWGPRSAGQVFVRLGPDEKIAGGSELYSERHLRSVTVLRVDAPEFTLEGRSGRPRPAGPAPTTLTTALDRMEPNPDIWDRQLVVGGPDGIVATRPSGGSEFGGWLYDLWLLERLAAAMRLTPLPNARIGPAWTVPYGLGRSTKPER
ncbi:MAG TPA: hypothetical protein VEX39_13200 [Thermoleophilaceae bacterium]|nr:hypothetical protein [Thermoleophilaceae bacterium]